MSIARECPQCGTVFDVPYPSISKKYCSLACSAASQAHPPKNCEYCGAEFKDSKQARKRFCTKQCWYAWHRGEQHPQYTKATLECEWCGSSFSRNLYELTKVKHYYCSYACSGKARSVQMRGGNTPNPSTYYQLAAWRRLRKDIINRDKGCLVCGLTEEQHLQRFGRSLHVDHVVPRKDGGSDESDNLQTLCCKHHVEKTQRGA